MSVLVIFPLMLVPVESLTVTETSTLLESLSVTVIVAVPFATPVTVTVSPFTVAVATDESLDVTVYGLVPPVMIEVFVSATETPREAGSTVRGEETPVIFQRNLYILVGVTISLKYR